MKIDKSERRGQEKMKVSQEEMEVSQEKMKEDMKRSKEELKKVLKISQEELKEDMKRINQVKEEVKEDKKEFNKKIEDLETKFRQLSTTGIIKTEGSVAATKIKVPTYDGKVSWNTYLRQFEAVVRNWREEKATSLIAALREMPIYSMSIYQTQLRNRKQRFEETLQQYEADVSRMVNLAYPTAPANVIEQLSVSSFVDELRDPEISQLVRLARHTTISAALAQALEIEAAKEASRFAINPYQVEIRR
ncbi:hypothetical protein NQ315_010635 [Exocentrus adspersus]|uniref:Uncharacterized protein n=1 Tax=Exocentrus adspersus TaxID=1586481 RepID=A0AAV8W6R5_9CUCU|nr:hypothetical protein NQ315_010635 [Exocentrus adspersus]